MKIKIGNKFAVEIYNDVVKNVLNLYPEEELIKRPFFEEGFREGFVSYKGLQDECESIQIPWQMFFLNPVNLKKQLERIDKQRKYKFSKKFFSKRKGVGDTTSKRIIDRLIRLQNYIVQNFSLLPNNFCGSLKSKTHSECVEIFLNYFEIDLSEFRAKQTEKAFDYLIGRIEAKSINISRGVLKGGVLPEVNGVNKVYKNTSGFVIKNEFIPFIFLPDEINPDEVMGRRIYTLIYLLVCIGLDEYEFYIENNFKASALKMRGSEAKKHNITAAILFPENESDALKEIEINSETISRLSKKFKITPTAVVVILKKRKIITDEEYQELLPPEYKPPKRKQGHRQRPKITTAVRKFCGAQAFSYINKGIKTGSLKSIEAQYLMFGHVHKKQFKEYCTKIGV